MTIPNIPSSVQDAPPDARTLILLDSTARQDRWSALVKPVPAIIDGEHTPEFYYSKDSEYWHTSWKTLLEHQAHLDNWLLQYFVTVQFSHLILPHHMIFAHPAFEEWSKAHGKRVRHDVFRSGFAPFDYLQALIRAYPACDLTAQLRREPDQLKRYNLPKCRFVEYGFFNLVDQYADVTGLYQDDIGYLIRHGALRYEKRLRAQTDTIWNPTCEPGWVITLNGIDHNLVCAKMDFSAVHGHVSLEKFAGACGIPMIDKSWMHEDYRIERMHEIYYDFPVEYDRYALADVDVPPQAFRKNAALLGEVYRALGVEEAYKGESAMSVGMTVEKLFERVLVHACGLDPTNSAQRQAFLAKYCTLTSTQHLSQCTETTRYLASKCFGGRAVNEQGSVVALHEPQGDMDINGAYTNTMKHQPYVLGTPEIHANRVDNPHAKRLTLGQFLRKYRKEFVPLLWMIVVSSDGLLNYRQDLVPSWFDFRLEDLRQPVPDGMTDSQPKRFGVKTDTGTAKILTRQIIHGVITHDTLQWMDEVMSSRQRREWMDKLYVDVALYYPKSKQVFTFAALEQYYDTHEAVKPYDEHQHAGAWYALNLGELIVETLANKRNDHKKKTPENEQYKLVINTLYGDMVSKYFPLSNTVVATNVTSRVRTMMWYLAKALHLQQSITDGGAFPLRRVLYPPVDRVLSAADLMLPTRTASRGSLRPLGGYENIDLLKERNPAHDTDTTQPKYLYTLTCDQDTYCNDAAKKWIADAALQHVRSVFPHPNIDLLRKPIYTLEIKELFNIMAYHGVANYYGDFDTLSMRAYERKQHHSATLAPDGSLVLADTYDHEPPAIWLMRQLCTNPDALERCPPFVKTAIAKFIEWATTYPADPHLRMNPGQTVLRVGLLREYSESQFLFESYEQYHAHKRWVQAQKRAHHQSAEQFFLEQRLLNYPKLLQTMERIIREGQTDFTTALDPHNNRHRNDNTHPYAALYQALQYFVKKVLQNPSVIVTDNIYGDDVDEDMGDYPDSWRYRAD